MTGVFLLENLVLWVVVIGGCWVFKNKLQTLGDWLALVVLRMFGGPRAGMVGCHWCWEKAPEHVCAASSRQCGHHCHHNDGECCWCGMGLTPL